MKIGIVFILFVYSQFANSTLIELADCTGAEACTITTSPPDPVQENPNDGVLLAWDEVQNFTLLTDLRVDRVFDDTATFVEDLGNGDYLIKAGTIVSSHYLQWDPLGANATGSVTSTIKLDSQVFAFITADANLENSDFLGLPGLDYNDFSLRGLESGDTTVFNGTDVDIDWTASSPGDWTRLITAFSPAAELSEPRFGLLILLLLISLLAFRLKNLSRYKGPANTIG